MTPFGWVLVFLLLLKVSLQVANGIHKREPMTSRTAVMVVTAAALIFCTLHFGTGHL